MIKILFVCHGNICRSPMAEFIFKDLVKKKGLENKYFVRSSATSTEEIWGDIGNPVYPPARDELKKHGIDCSGKTAVLVTHDISEAISMSDKIIVLTHRPAQVKSIFRPNLKGDSPIRKRESKDFGLMFEKIWKELL